MRDQADIPEFLLEALGKEACNEDAAMVAALAIAELPLLLSPQIAALGRERLLGAVHPLPLRYAPFYDRLAALWNLPVAAVEAVLLRANEPSSWRKPGLPGLTLIDVEPGPALRGARVTLVRFARGMRFPAHSHPGPETLLVLEGSYCDSGGRHVGPGELHEMAPGTQHSFRVGRGEPCVAASVQFGLEFTGIWMRLLTKLFG
ncbi:MAG TPA: cupin domain-containing protein [Polyangiaceae bacterium]|nr:cupin domain-containing protein [Polyangiaceae bacterium]